MNAGVYGYPERQFYVGSSIEVSIEKPEEIDNLDDYMIFMDLYSEGSKRKKINNMLLTESGTIIPASITQDMLGRYILSLTYISKNEPRKIYKDIEVLQLVQ